MKTRRSHAAPKTRPVAALLIVVFTLFLLAGRACGVAGALLSASVERLLGAAGTGLLVATLWCIAFILATAPGTATRLVVALWHATVTRRHTAAVVVIKSRSGGDSARGEGVDAGPVTTVSTLAPRHPFANNVAPALAPALRRELQTVRDALKHLGYEKHEYEPLVARMDPTAGFEKNVKSALKALQAN